MPLVGEPDTDGRLATFIQNLRIEAGMIRGPYIENDEARLNLFLYGTDCPPTNGQLPPHIYNKVQGMIHTFVDLVTRTDPVMTITPTTVMDALPGQPQVNPDGTPMVDATGVPLPTPPLTVTSVAGESRLVDSAMIAEWLQVGFDIKMDESRVSQWFRDMVEQTQIFGSKQSLIDWDDDLKVPLLHIFPALQWWNDPNEPNLEKQQYVGLDWPIDAQRAKRLYPDLSKQIDFSASKQVYQPAGSQGMSQVYQNISYARPFVTMSTFWLRNREQAMTSQEAVQSGHVQLAAIPIEGRDNADSSLGEPATPGDSGDSTNPLDTEIVAPSGDADESGSDTDPTQLAQPTTREAMIHGDTGQEIDQNHPLWPIKYVTTRVTLLMDKVVKEVVSDCYDGIQVVVNYNVRIPGRPFGQGETDRVQGLQNDLNNVHGAIVNHTGWYRAPWIVMPNAIRDALPDDSKDALAQPGKIWYVDDEMFKSLNGKVFQAYDPPAMPPALLTTEKDLIDGFNAVGGNPDVQQGVTPTSNASGQLVEALQQAAESSTGVKFKYLQEMLWRTGKICLWYFLNYLDAQAWYEMNRTYDLDTTTLLLAIAQSLKFNIKVDIAQGAAKAQKDAQIRSDAVSVPPIIDMETARDKLGYDSKEIESRLMQAQQQQLQVQAAVAGAQQGATQSASSASGGSARPHGPSMPGRSGSQQAA